MHAKAALQTRETEKRTQGPTGHNGGNAQIDGTLKSPRGHAGPNIASLKNGSEKFTWDIASRRRI